AHTFILRQSMAISYEAPFLYLLFGNDRALLLDTGATADATLFPLRRTVDELMNSWLEENPRTGYQLVVAHSHAHSDHVAGDGQFAGRPDTVVVCSAELQVRTFFGLTEDPDDITVFDLGGRTLQVIACPGHHPTSIAIFDHWTGWLLTGDTVYPGRLYVRDYPAFAASIDRLAEFATGHPVSAILGCHIEMTKTAGRDYPIGVTFQPDERPLPLTVNQLLRVREATHAVADRPGAHAFDDVVIFNGPCRAAVARQLIRALWQRLRPPPDQPV
ncbi:MAG: MBL fold metallo-hydrolase, partial [Nakamurella sp.]